MTPSPSSAVQNDLAHERWNLSEGQKDAANGKSVMSVSSFLKLETLIGKPKTAQEQLCQAQDHGESMKESHDKALEDLAETKEVLRVTEILSKIYEIEYKSARQELGEAEVRLQTTRDENHRSFLVKKTAERLLRIQENCTKEVVEMVERLRGDLAAVRALVAEGEPETSHMWPSRKIGCVISVGTGVLISRDLGGTIKPLFDKLTEMGTDTEKLASEFEEEMRYRHGIEQRVCFRFNLQHGREQVGLEEWKEMDKTKVAIQDYMKSVVQSLDPWPASKLRRCGRLRALPSGEPQCIYIYVNT